jgi:hypothetical protein
VSVPVACLWKKSEDYNYYRQRYVGVARKKERKKERKKKERKKGKNIKDEKRKERKTER